MAIEPLRVWVHRTCGGEHCVNMGNAQTRILERLRAWEKTRRSHEEAMAAAGLGGRRRNVRIFLMGKSRRKLRFEGYLFCGDNKVIKLEVNLRWEICPSVMALARRFRLDIVIEYETELPKNLCPGLSLWQTTGLPDCSQ